MRAGMRLKAKRIRLVLAGAVHVPSGPLTVAAVHTAPQIAQELCPVVQMPTERATHTQGRLPGQTVDQQCKSQSRAWSRAYLCDMQMGVFGMLEEVVLC